MGKIYITGHRNPDMDSICSAYSYAVLKNRIDPENEYVAVRCGNMSDAVKQQFALLDVEAPIYLRDVFPKVKDVMLREHYKLDASDPIYNLIRMYDESKPSAMPVFDGDRFFGLLTVDDISAWFLRDNADECPVYELRVSNILPVISGTLLHGDGKGTFSAPLLAGTATFDYFRSYVEKRRNPVVVMPFNDLHIRHCIEKQVPAIIITACAEPVTLDFSAYHGCVITTSLDTAETLRRIRMAPAISTILGEQGKRLQDTDLYVDAKSAFANVHHRGLSVFSGETWVGFVTRRCFLNCPAYDVILVDHNEPTQSIRGIETARVCEIIDHHRLDALKTDVPLFVYAEPLGSTCTIIYQQFLRHSCTPDPKTAKVLLAGIISDTLILRSPTTTIADKVAAGALAAISGEYDINRFGEQLFGLTASLMSVAPEIAIRSDFKEYSESGVRLGIGQFETTVIGNVDEYAESYISELEKTRRQAGCDWVMLMVTDVIRGTSILLTTDSRYARNLPYNEVQRGVYAMPGVMSRKKQLLPEIIHAIEN